MNKHPAVGVLVGGISSEREISLATGKAVIDAIKRLGYTATEIPYDESLESITESLHSVDIIFNALHGGDGENGEVQAFLDALNIIYTGSDAAASKVCMDKNHSKMLVREAGLTTPEWQMLKQSDDIILNDELKFPLIVKPNDQGSTVGLTIVHDRDDLATAVEKAFSYSSSILVEQYISGKEMTVTILADKAYPVVEIIPSHELYDYECKYSRGMSEYVCPAVISAELERQLMDDALTIHRLLGCRDYSRVDFRVDEDESPWFLEVNTLPGMTATSLVPKSLKAAGYSFENLIDSILTQARVRWQKTG